MDSPVLPNGSRCDALASLLKTENAVSLKTVRVCRAPCLLSRKTPVSGVITVWYYFREIPTLSRKNKFQKTPDDAVQDE